MVGGRWQATFQIESDQWTRSLYELPFVPAKPMGQ